MVAYRNVLNSMINDIWNSIEWKDKKIRGKKQIRIIPFYDKSNEFKKRLTHIFESILASTPVYRYGSLKYARISTRRIIKLLEYGGLPTLLSTSNTFRASSTSLLKK